jgi:hypothetical protein
MVKQKNIITCCLYAALAIACFGCNQAENTNATEVPAEVVNSTSEPAKPAVKAAVDKNEILGNWTRTDAPYNLTITNLSGDGSMKAAYFNPKSIHVGKATWANENGALKLYVELRDENYPGSIYTLFYIPERDLLAGKYFQAVEGVTYDVGFMRAK